jgi:hypothetical protein
VGLSAAQQAIPVVADAVAPGIGLGPVGEVWLMPDWATLQRLPYAPGQARVMGNMVSDGQPAIAALLSSPSRWQNPWRPWSRIRYCWMPWVSPWPRRTWRCGGPNWPPWQA